MGGATAILICVVAGASAAFALDAAGLATRPPQVATTASARLTAHPSAPPATPADATAAGERTVTRAALSVVDRQSPPPTSGPHVLARPVASHPSPPFPPNLSPARLLAGVGPIPDGWVAASYTILSGGLSRTYLTIQPRDLHQSVPVVVLIHGRDMNPDGILQLSHLADSIGPSVIIVPAGWHEFWNAGECCGPASQAGIDDVGFIHSAVARVLSSNSHADASAVYAIGFSNGGRLAYHLACQLPGLFKAFMAVEAVPVQSCPAMHPLDITMVAEQNDPLLTVDAGHRPKTVGGLAEPTVAATVIHMEALDGCRSRPAVADYGRSVEQTWTCAGGALLRYVWYPGGAHSWRPTSGSTPGATAYAQQLMGRGGPAPAQPNARSLTITPRA
jgi:polyhydroxybutyrate depolymerase